MNQWWSLLLRFFVLVTWIGVTVTSADFVQAQSTAVCPLKQGYWKDHPEAWPRQTLVLGNPNNTAHTYTQSALLTLLKLSTQGDASIILAQQLIAAKVNIFNGTNRGPIASTLTQGDGLFSGFPGKLPYGVRTNTALGKSMTAIALVLENYNAGKLPDSCGSENVAPLANAGSDQTVFVWDTVQLDGSASSDVDGDQLTYNWSFISRPPGSQATLSDSNAVKPSFMIDSAGTYELRLVVNDGTLDSAPDTVKVSTQNSRPIADAGPDQTVPLGSRVFLDGRGSRDVDSNPLTYRWQFLGRPQGSVANLDDPLLSQPTFSADRPGSYTIELIVNDGNLDSAPDTVVVSTENSKPVANAGTDQTVFQGNTVYLDGSGSTDADGDSLGYFWSFGSKPQNSGASLSNPTIVNPNFVADVEGLYVVQLIVGDGKSDSDPDTASITVEVLPPVNRSPVATDDSAITSVDIPITVTVMGNDHDPDGDSISISAVTQGANGKVTQTSATVSYSPSAAFHGVDNFTYTISDGRGGSATANVAVTVDQPPQVDAGSDQTISLPASASLAGNVTDDGLPNPPGLLTIGWTKVSGPGAVTFANSNAASTTASFSGSGTYVLRLTAYDGFLSTTDDISITVNPVGGPLPPDPATIAPPVDQTVVTTIDKSTEFLYTGDNPIQTGVAPGTIEPRRAAVIRGKVLTRDGTPLSGVKLTIQRHPEFGQTLSRADGMFDMAVNGGGLLTVNYEKLGFLPAQRQVNVPWQDFAIAPDMVLLQVDSQVSTIVTNASVMQVARGSVVSDNDGSRQATVLFPAGTGASVILADGSLQSVATFSVRATEYTVGPNGPATMPAPLPPTSGYTYAVELSADEAVAKIAGRDVVFSQPVSVYVENFLRFPVGGIVPVGFYDRDKAAWIPSENGRVVKITGVVGGLATVDTVGTEGLQPISLSDAERQQLAGLYPVGQELWRAPVAHFSTWDINWPFAPPLDATPPRQPRPEPPPTPDQPCPGTVGGCSECKDTGSILGCQSQTLGEAVPIAGTPFQLHYSSDRAPGRRSSYSLNIPLSGTSVPSSLKRIVLEIGVAGRVFVQSFPPMPNQQTRFVWDGLDAYGRMLEGSQPINLWIGYTYDGVYQEPYNQATYSVFGYNGNGTRITGDRTRSEITIWQFYTTRIGTLASKVSSLGGWTLSAHHAYDPGEKVFYGGDGSRMDSFETTRRARIATAVGYYGSGFFGGDGGWALIASLWSPYNLAFAPDGSYYIVDYDNARIRRVDANNIITTYAGNGIRGFSGDGGPATQASLNDAIAIAVAPDSSVYIADNANHRIRRVGLDGIITTVVGTGTQGFTGDGGPAIKARLNHPVGIAFSSDGTFYIADRENHRIRRVGVDGIITTVAGNGSVGFGGDGGPATQANLNIPNGVAVGRDGSLYIADRGNRRIRRVTPDGIITTVAGNGTFGFSGDGGPATEAALTLVRGVSIDSDDSLYIADYDNHRIRRVAADGIITSVAGNGTADFTGEYGLPAQASLSGAYGTAVGPDGRLYIADTGNNRIRRVEPSSFGLGAELGIASQDGRELYLFGGSKHLRTVNALTGADLYLFSYDSAGRLVQITEKTGATDTVTIIHRDSSGNPTKITAPFGQETLLAVGPRGNLGIITNPANETTSMNYYSGGLLETFTNSRGHTSRYSYDNLGLLILAEDAAGGFKTFSRSVFAGGSSVTKTTSLGRTTVYRSERLSTGNQLLRTTLPGGEISELLIKTDGTSVLTQPDGTIITTVSGPDPRWGMQAPATTSETIKTPNGRTRQTTTVVTASLQTPDNPLSLVSLTRTTTVNGRTTTSSYTAASRTTVITSPLNRTQTIVTDPLGRPVSYQIAGLAVSAMSYDSRGRLANITVGSGPTARLTSYAYNAQGYLQSITDPVGRAVQRSYDAAGRVTSQTFPDGRVVGFSYDAEGNLVGLAPPGRPAHTFDYSNRDELTLYTPPNVPGTGPTSYAYDSDRALTMVGTPDSRGVEIGYDSAGRLATRSFSTDGVVTGTDTTDYDSAGRIASIAGMSGVSHGFTYDGGLDTREDWTGTLTGSVSRTYDDVLRLASEAVNGGFTVSFGYDNDDLVTTLGIITVTRDAQNGLPTGTSTGIVTTATGYNEFGEETSFSSSANGAQFYGVGYTRDKLGRITQKTETVGGVADTYSYSYDLAGRLTGVDKNGASVESYGYDDNGNRTSATVNGLTSNATYDDQDRLLQYGAVTYIYRAAGELLSNTIGGQTTTYQYDHVGNLLGATLPNGNVISYIIDGRDRRVGKKVNGQLVQQFLYKDSLRPVAELDGAGNIVSRFVYGSRNVPEYMLKNSVNYRIITDQIGSVRLVVARSTGAVVQRLDYDSFGNVIQDTNPGFQPFGFAGGLYDRGTRLVRFGARDYNSESGRWTTKDPIGVAGGDTNLYGYVLSDPLNRIDPTGLSGLRLSCELAPSDRQPGIVTLTQSNPEFTNLAREPDFLKKVEEDIKKATENYKRRPHFYAPRTVGGIEGAGGGTTAGPRD